MCIPDSTRQPDTIPASPEVLAHVVDVHCHPTDSPIDQQQIDSLHIRVCAMATRPSDQGLVYDFAIAHPDKVIPCFGW